MFKYRLPLFMAAGFVVFCRMAFGQAADSLDADTLRQSLINLPWSEKELTAISGIANSDLYTGSSATEKNFKKLAPDYGIIHLSTHAIIDDREPLYSKFVFSAENEGEEDGYLYTYELYNMRLNAKLAVLSACNTGSGKMIRGEGIMSLARGFLYAGCPSIVMSLWAIDDKATSMIMADFYKGLMEGRSKDEALRDAKLSLLRSGDPVLANPYYWAGLVVIGDTSPLEINAPQHYYGWWILAAIGVMAGIFVLVKLRRR